MSFFKVNHRCNGCLACVQNCPATALSYRDIGEKRKLMHNMTRCARCGNCWRVCPQDAVEFQHILTGQWDDVVTMDLVRCAVCGEPLYTQDFGDTLAGKLDKNVEHLCALHRKSLALEIWKRVTPEKTKPNEVGK